MAFITNTDLGRLMTEEEIVSRDEKLTEMFVAGLTDGNSTVGDAAWKMQRTWSTEAAANEWLAFMNALTPGPLSATVTEV